MDDTISVVQAISWSTHGRHVYADNGRFKCCGTQYQQEWISLSGEEPKYRLKFYGYCIYPDTMARGCIVDVSRGGDTCESVAWMTEVLPRRGEDVESQSNNGA